MIEKLLVKLEADVKDYIRDMDKANKSTKETGENGGKSAGLLAKLGGAARVAAVPIASMAVGAAALGAALSAMALQAASNRKELERYSRQAKMSTGDFAALAFAARQYGLDADSVADITKDLSDRFGEFATAGSGAFQDFANVMGLSAREARVAAVEFGKMSGRDAIQAMVSQMEKAGATGGQMTFVLESMGSELSRLTPLFSEQGKELQRLEGRYNKLNSELSLSGQQAEDLKGLSESFDLVQSSVGKASDAIGARFAPYLTNLINSVIDVVPAATNTIIDFFNSFVDAENINSVRDVDAQIQSTTESIGLLQQKLNESGSLMSLQKGVLVSDQKAALEANIEAEKNRLLELQLQKEMLEEQNEQYKIQAAIKRGGGEIGVGGTGGGGVSNFDKDEREKSEEELQKIFDQKFAESEVIREAEEQRLAMLEEFSMTRREALVNQYLTDLELLKEFQEKTKASDEELYAKKLEIAEKFSKDVSKLNTEEVKDTKQKEDAKEKQLEGGLQAAKLIGAALFEDNKAVQAGLIIADTASAIMKSLSINPYDYVNVGIIAATGAIQLANALSASKGGGSTSGASSGGGQTITNKPSDFEQESTSLEVSSTFQGQGSSTQRVSLSVDDSEDFLDALAEKIATRTRAN